MIKQLQNDHYHSVSDRLRKLGKTNEEFEVRLNNLSLEDLISLKLELMCKLVKGKFCFPIYHTVEYIVKQSVLQFAENSGKTNRERSMLVGLKLDTYKKMCRKYDVKKYFINENIHKRKS